LNMTTEELEALLFEDESTTLDFKREQYRFENEPDSIKSELLKDILAFANAWRRTDAYILIGIEEVKGSRSHVIGVSSHLDDASLQQFVNTKIQRPLEFTYQVARLEEKEIGILHIPVQQRPFYLQRSFGKLSLLTVYVRRGSSTAKADPDEIAKMGADLRTSLSPEIEIQFAVIDKREVCGKLVTIDTVLLETPNNGEIPDNRSNGLSSAVGYGMENKDYYRDAAHYLHQTLRVKPIRFALSNNGVVTAHGVRAELNISGKPNDFFVSVGSSLPVRPARNRLYSHLGSFFPNHGDVKVEPVKRGCHVAVEFGTCQPKQVSFNSTELYIGTMTNCELNIEALLFADELPKPIEQKLVAIIHVENRRLSLKELLEFEDD